MKHTVLILAALALPAVAGSDPLDFQPLFDGKSLEHWDGNPDFWSVQDGVITGQTTAEKPTKRNTFLVWKGGELDDFELKVDFKIESGNSGIQIRSFPLEGAADQWRIGGYQADFDFSQKFAGLIYGEKYRGILAKRGEKATIGDNGKPVVTGATGDPAELVKAIKTGGWNTFHVVAKGNHIKQSINGVLMAELFDQRREVVDAASLPSQVVHAFLAAEDSSFYHHEGLDFPGILRAAWANLREGRVVQGGSTITQQVAKSLLLTPERSLRRKAREAVLALRIERNLSKAEILHL